jgi:hypothetical protein
MSKTKKKDRKEKKEEENLEEVPLTIEGSELEEGQKFQY